MLVIVNSILYRLKLHEFCRQGVNGLEIRSGLQVTNIFALSSFLIIAISARKWVEVLFFDD